MKKNLAVFWDEIKQKKKKYPPVDGYFFLPNTIKNNIIYNL